MDPFTKVDSHYREFSLQANVGTVLGFKAGDLIVFKQCEAKDAQREHEIVAVSRPGSQQIEIGQVFFAQAPDADPSKRTLLGRYIRLWDNRYGEFHRDFDVHGVILRPSKQSWAIRFGEQMKKGGRCCPHRECQPCTQIYPCSLSCPFLIPLDPQTLEAKQEKEIREGTDGCSGKTRGNCPRGEMLHQQREKEARAYLASLREECWCDECVERRRQEHWD